MESAVMNAKENCCGTTGSLESSTDEKVTAKVRSLFGEAIHEALQKEEINDCQLIEDLAAREPDAPIFTKLGFTYGKAVRFKKEFQVAHGAIGGHYSRGKRLSSPSPPTLKPTMAEMSSMSPEIRQLYLAKRKKIGILATQKWGNSLPKFNSPETKQQLTEFATEITPECGITEINFNTDGIARHIQTYFSEQRRYQKNKKPSYKSETELKVEKKKKKQKVEDVMSASGELSSSGSSSGVDSCSAASSEGGDTEAVIDDEENECSDSPPYTQVPSNVVSQAESAWESNLVMNQAIVKGVFGRVLKRDDIVHILKKKFAVQQKNLTGLTPTQLMNVLAKKLVRHEYCRLTGGAKNKENITVVKEIDF